MNLQTCKKIIFAFILNLGLILVPRVSFAYEILSPDGVVFNLPDGTQKYFVYWYEEKSRGRIGEGLVTNNANDIFSFDGSLLWLNSSSNGVSSITLHKTGVIDFNGFTSDAMTVPIDAITSCISFTSLGLPHNFVGFPYNKSSDIVPNFLHIIGSFSNASVNISSGSEITENIVVTANEDYKFTSVQNGFVLSDDDTVATYDISDLTGDFNLVATDFVTQLIGSDDPPIDPPIDPPSDDPIIIGDIELVSAVPVGTWFSNIFSDFSDILVTALPFIIGFFGIWIALIWLIKILRRS